MGDTREPTFRRDTPEEQEATLRDWCDAHGYARRSHAAAAAAGAAALGLLLGALLFRGRS
jgi:hypothetical protein